MLLDAIRAKDIQVVRQLLSKGGVALDPPAKPYSVNKPLAYACAYGSLDIVKLLVEAGADPNGRTAYGDTPLIKADEHGNYDICEYLIEVGADINVPNDFGVSPFIGLCGGGKLELVRLAIKHNADVNARYVAKIGAGTGKLNYSPLQAAVWNGRKEVVHLLLCCNASTTVRDNGGQTLVQLADMKGDEEISTMLRERGE